MYNAYVALSHSPIIDSLSLFLTRVILSLFHSSSFWVSEYTERIEEEEEEEEEKTGRSRMKETRNIRNHFFFKWK
jgi:hypothetical protein